MVLLYWQLQHKICTKSQDLALKISRREGATPSRTHPQHGHWPCTPSAPLPVSEPMLPKCSPKSKIATTPLPPRRDCTPSAAKVTHCIQCCLVIRCIEALYVSSYNRRPIITTYVELYDCSVVICESSVCCNVLNSFQMTCYNLKT